MHRGGVHQRGQPIFLKLVIFSPSLTKSTFSQQIYLYVYIFFFLEGGCIYIKGNHCNSNWEKLGQVFLFSRPAGSAKNHLGRSISPTVLPTLPTTTLDRILLTRPFIHFQTAAVKAETIYQGMLEMAGNIISANILCKFLNCYAIICEQFLKDMLSWTALSMYLGMKTTFYTKYI